MCTINKTTASHPVPSVSEWLDSQIMITIIFSTPQFCTNRDTSNKKDFPTFARTRPPDTQISKSVLSLLLAYNWTHVTFLYLETSEDEYRPVANTIISTLQSANIYINAVKTWSKVYHHGYARNPFDEIVESTFMDTRSNYRWLGGTDCLVVGVFN